MDYAQPLPISIGAAVSIEIDLTFVRYAIGNPIMLIRTMATALSLAALLVVGCETSEFDSPNADPTVVTPSTTDEAYPSASNPPVQPEAAVPGDVTPDRDEPVEPADATPGDATSTTPEADATEADTIEDPAVEEVPAES